MSCACETKGGASAPLVIGPPPDMTYARPQLRQATPEPPAMRIPWGLLIVLALAYYVVRDA